MRKEKHKLSWAVASVCACKYTAPNIKTMELYVKCVIMQERKFHPKNSWQIFLYNKTIYNALW